MKRTIDRYRNCDPTAMSRMPEAAQFFAYQDWKADILELYRQRAELAALLSCIAYPGRGGEWDNIDIHTAAERIQAKFTLEQLQEMEGRDE